MVKSVLGVNHQGLTEWLVQRVSAIVMAIYFIGIIIYLAMHPQLDYATWHTLFTCTAMKIVTLLFILSLLFHAWIGVWTVLTDYVKPFVLRLSLHLIFFFALVACFFWALQILWSV